MASRIAKFGKRGAVAAALASGLLAAAQTPAHASWYAAHPWGDVHLRDCYHPNKQPYPNTNCTDLGWVYTNTNVRIVCQYAGQNVGGDAVWDYIVVQDGSNREGYVADYYVTTGYSSWIPGVDRCNY